MPFKRVEDLVRRNVCSKICQKTCQKNQKNCRGICCTRPSSAKNFVAGSLFLAIACGSLSSLPSLASPFPGSGAPLAAVRQMTSDGSDPTNPFSYPFLANITRSLAHNGIPPGFFLGSEGKAAGGIDLRTLLLFEAGVLKSPVKLFLPSRKRPEDSLPSLSMPPIPENSGEMPSLGRRLNSPEEDANLAGAPQVVAKPSLSLDFNRLTLSANTNQAKQAASETPETQSILASGPFSTAMIPSATTAASRFRFWTVYPGGKVLEKKILGAETNYDGSFVLSSPGGIRSIEGRTFFLKAGRIMAFSKDKPIDIDSQQVKVSIQPGATVLVEYIKPGLTLVRALETRDGQNAVIVKMTKAGKSEEEKLAGGDDLIVSDHTLSSADKTLTGTSGTAQSDESWARGKFSVSTVLEKDPFLRVDGESLNPEQRYAIQALRKRLKN